MQLALRPYVTTGIALVGASVIAMSPISPVTPDIHVPSISTTSVAVQLTGAVTPTIDPFNAWVQVAAGVVSNVAVLGQQVWEFGTPVLNQVLANQMGYFNLISTSLKNTINGLANWQSNNQGLLDYAYSLLKAGQVGEAISYYTYALVAGVQTLFPMIDILKIPGLITRNISNVVNLAPAIAMSLGLSAVTAATAPIHAFGRQMQGLLDAVNAGDPLSAVNAVLNIPAAMTGAFLDSLTMKYYNGLTTGLIGGLVIGIREFIAQAIKPPAPPVAPAAVETAPDTLVADISSISRTAISAIGGAGTITLSPATESPAAETPVEGTPAAETPVEETPAAEAPVEEAPVEETPVVDVEPVIDAEPIVEAEPVAEAEVETEPTTLVRDSVQAKPGQLGLTKASEASANLAKSARGEISKVANKIDEGIKKALGQPAKTAATQSAGSDNDGGSNE